MDEYKKFLGRNSSKQYKHLYKLKKKIKFEKRKSNLKETEFFEDKNKGIFVLNDIPEGTVILTYEDEYSYFMNDPLMNLKPLKEAKNSRDFYNELENARKTYYDIDKMKKYINIALVSSPNNRAYYETIKDIKSGDELLRAYGFTTWLFGIFELISLKTLAGYTRFILNFMKISDFSRDPDPSREKIKTMASISRECFDPFTEKEKEKNKSGKLIDLSFCLVKIAGVMEINLEKYDIEIKKIITENPKIEKNYENLPKDLSYEFENRIYINSIINNIR